MKTSKNSDYKFNYVFLFYDIGEKRVTKVFKICKKYLEHHQLSVFRGNITPSKIIKLKSELLKVINENEDRISIIKLPGRYSFEEETMGALPKDDEELFF